MKAVVGLAWQGLQLRPTNWRACAEQACSRPLHVLLPTIFPLHPGCIRSVCCEPGWH